MRIALWNVNGLAQHKFERGPIRATDPHTKRVQGDPSALGSRYIEPHCIGPHPYYILCIELDVRNAETSSYPIMSSLSRDSFRTMWEGDCRGFMRRCH